MSDRPATSGVGDDRWPLLGALVAAIVIAAALLMSLRGGGETGPIRVGVLHSLSGTMAISARAVSEATLLAIDELNAGGGLLGRTIEPVVRDGASDPLAFARAAERLITADQVVATFGCWTSSGRKQVKPVIGKVVEFEAADDYGLGPVRLEYIRSVGEGDAAEFTRGELPVAIVGTRDGRAARRGLLCTHN